MKENELLLKLVKINKLIMILLIAILILLTMGVSKMYVSKDANTSASEESEYNTEYDVSMFDEITAKDVKSKTKNKLQVVYIGRETCGWCAAFLPNIWDAQKEFDFTTLYIDIAKIIDFSDGSVIDQNSFDILNALTGEGYEEYMSENFGATPMILIIKDNKIVGAHTGYSEYDVFKTALNDAGIK